MKRAFLVIVMGTLCATWLASCGGGSSTDPDGGVDATVRDAAQVDASASDAGFDASIRDAGHEMDAATIDAGPADAGGPDAGPPDGGDPFPCAATDFTGPDCGSQSALASGPGGVVVHAFVCRGGAQVSRFEPGSGWSDLPAPSVTPFVAEQTFDVAVDDTGGIVLAYIESVSIDSRPVHVLRFDGTSWAPIGPALPGAHNSIRLQVRGASVYVAMRDGTTGLTGYRVHRLDAGDTAWRAYPDPTGELGTGGWNPIALGLDTAGEPVLAFIRYSGGDDYQLRVARFVATAPDPVGSWTTRILVPTGNAHNPALVMAGEIAYIAHHLSLPGSSTTILRRVDLAGTEDTVLDTIASDATSVSHGLALARAGTRLLAAAGGQSGPSGAILVRIYDEATDTTIDPGTSTLNPLSRVDVLAHEGKMLVGGSFNLGANRVECFPIPE